MTVNRLLYPLISLKYKPSTRIIQAQKSRDKYLDSREGMLKGLSTEPPQHISFRIMFCVLLLLVSLVSSDVSLDSVHPLNLDPFIM